MNRIMKRLIALTLSCLMIILAFGSVVSVMAASTSGNSVASGKKRMNVVFVLDQSGSMKNTDPNRYSFESIDLFMGLSTESGNHMGFVVFDDKIILKRDLKEMTGTMDKNDFSRELKKVNNNGGDTDIGGAIEMATRMLDSDADPSLDSAVILLTDGNTDFSEVAKSQDDKKNLEEDSKNAKSSAINTARNKGYKIYSVCLNANGTADVSETRDISVATGGECTEVKTADDLKDVFTMFYGLIYGTDTKSLFDGQLDGNGELEIPFHVGSVGIEEANIIVDKNNQSIKYKLYTPKPDGTLGDTALSDTELNAMTNSASALFDIIKISSPTPGDWKLYVKGDPNARVKIDLVCNASLSLLAETNLQSAPYTIGKGETAEIYGYILDQNGKVTDQKPYDLAKFTVAVENKDAKQYNEYPMTIGNQVAAYNFIGTEKANYEITIKCEVDETTLVSNVIELSVDNHVPVAGQNEFEIVKKIPFEKNIFEYDLSQCVSDVEDAQLQYEIDPLVTTATADAAALDADKLAIDLSKFQNKEELVGIIATDSDGASCSFTVKIIKKNLLLIIIPTIVGIILLILAIIGIRVFIENNKYVRGKLFITLFDYDGDGESETVDGRKGKMILSRYIDIRKDTGINLSKVYIKAGERDSFVYLCSPKGLFTESTPDIRNKMIRIDAEMEYTISNDPDMEKGIRITFIPDDGYSF